jgi:hypothetical protein
MSEGGRLQRGLRTAALTGTLADDATEAQIVSGGETLIITLTGDTWDATIGADNAKTTALIAGIDSAQSETNGWDACVKANLDYNDVVRTSATVVTITLGAEATYDITANETITVTVPATAVAGSDPIVATPTFDVTFTPTSAALTGTLGDGAGEAAIVAGGETLIITLTGDTWDATIGADNAKTTALIAGIDSAQSEANGWDAVVKANLDYNDVVRTSATVVTITLGAEATYDISASETVTVTVPATAIAGASPIVATPTFAITPVGITFRAAASANGTTGNLTIAKPTGTVEDDVMVAAIGVRPDTATITPPTGWTLVRRIDNTSTNANSLAVYRKNAGGSEPANYTWTLGSPTGSAGGIQTFVGVDLTTPVDIENGQTTASALTHATPDVTTTVGETMLVTAHSFSSTATWTPPGGMTEGFDDTGGAQATEGAYVLQASAGATGAKTATASADADVGNAHILALTPAGVSAVLTGTLADDAVEDAIITGGETLVITLSGDTWDATIGADNAKTTALIAGIDSAQSEANGWDAVVKANLDYNDVVRTSATVVTITLGAEATYAITATETITVTVPATAVAGSDAVVATPTFQITRFLIQQRAAASASATTGNLTITKPTGTAVDDVMIASIGVQPNTTGITPPTGWTLVRRVDNATSTANSLAVYRKTAGGSEPANHTWTMTSATNSVGGIQSFSGVDTASPVDIENGQTTASSVSHATPNVTTTETDAMLVTSHTYASSATWTPPAGITEAVDVQSGGGSSTVESRVAAGADDAEEAGGTVDLGSSDLELVDEGASPQIVGMRFLSMTVPAGATITNAYIEFETDELDSDATSLTFWAEDEDNPGTFTTAAPKITGRTKTTASVPWNSIPAWGTESEKHQTPDLSAIIQEVVDRGGWASGNAIVVIVTGSGERTAEAYEGESANAPLLHVEYTDTVGGQSTEAGYALQATAGATGAKTATAAASADVGNTHILALTPKSFLGAALTGTLTSGVNEYDITTGGETLIITLTGDTWDATIGADNAKTTALIAGIDSAQAEATGWDAVVKANMDYNDVVRRDDHDDRAGHRRGGQRCARRHADVRNHAGDPVRLPKIDHDRPHQGRHRDRARDARQLPPALLGHRRRPEEHRQRGGCHQHERLRHPVPGDG